MPSHILATHFTQNFVKGISTLIEHIAREIYQVWLILAYWLTLKALTYKGFRLLNWRVQSSAKKLFALKSENITGICL